MDTSFDICSKKVFLYLTKEHVLDSYTEIFCLLFFGIIFEKKIVGDFSEDTEYSVWGQSK